VATPPAVADRTRDSSLMKKPLYMRPANPRL